MIADKRSEHLLLVNFKLTHQPSCGYHTLMQDCQSPPLIRLYQSQLQRPMSRLRLSLGGFERKDHKERRIRSYAKARSRAGLAGPKRPQSGP
jgi:hypothetical protein